MLLWVDVFTDVFPIVEFMEQFSTWNSDADRYLRLIHITEGLHTEGDVAVSEIYTGGSSKTRR